MVCQLLVISQLMRQIVEWLAAQRECQRDEHRDDEGRDDADLPKLPSQIAIHHWSGIDRGPRPRHPRLPRSGRGGGRLTLARHRRFARWLHHGGGAWDALGPASNICALPPLPFRFFWLSLACREAVLCPLFGIRFLLKHQYGKRSTPFPRRGSFPGFLPPLGEG